MKKAIAAVVALSLTAVMAGCGKDVSLESEGKNGKGYPDELSIWCTVNTNLTAGGAKDLNDNLFFQYMEEQTGTHVNWTHPSASSAEQNFNLMIASGVFSDMIVSDWSSKYQKEDMDALILPLGDLIEDNMPNLTKYLKENPDMKKQFVADSGEVFYIPIIREDKELCVYLGPQIRKDWLDKLGLEIPRTTDELYNVLKAFKTRNPNGGDGKDIKPMTGTGFAKNAAFDIGNLLWPFGAHYDFYLDGGEVKYGIMEPEFEEGLKYIRKLYAENLIDPDFLLNDRTKIEARVINNQVGFISGYQPTALQTSMDDGVRAVVGIPHLSGPNGGRKCFYKNYEEMVLNKISIAVSTACKDSGGALKWLDKIFGEPGLTYANWGREGVSYEVVDGKPRWTDYVMKNSEGRTPKVMRTISTLSGVETFPTIVQFEPYVQQLGSWGREAIPVWTDTADTSGIYPPAVSFTEQEAADIADVMSTVTTYMQESVTKIILGTEGIESLAAVRERIRGLGIDRIIKIYDDAYARYQKR